MRHGDAWQKIRVLRVAEISGRPVVLLEGIDTPEKASQLTNRAIAVPMQGLPPLEDGRHYVHEIIGCEVFDEADGRKLGEVTDIERYPANDVYVIRATNGSEILFPAVKDFVREIDTKARRIAILRAGLFDELEKTDGNEV